MRKLWVKAWLTQDGVFDAATMDDWWQNTNSPERMRYVTEEYIHELEAEMLEAADAMDFERAAAVRDRIVAMRDSVGRKVTDVAADKSEKRRGKRSGMQKVPRPRRRGKT